MNRPMSGPLTCAPLKSPSSPFNNRGEAGRDVRFQNRLVWLGGGSIRLLFVVLSCVGCATTRQSVADLNTGLAWFVPPEQAEGWPFATESEPRLERAPTVVVAWSPAPRRDGEPTALATRAVRERWIAAIKEKLDRSGRVTRVEGSPPDTFDGGVTVTGLQTLAADRGADVIVLFGLETDKRQYHAFEPLAGATGRPADVANVVEVVALARTVGVTPSGVPLFADTQKGFASAESHARTAEELEAISNRVAVDALADAIVLRLTQISPGKGSR
jgi:hypothetical protein